jgi:hypothetical protein
MKRYEMSRFMSEHPDGEWVWIKDHEAEIAQLREALEHDATLMRAYQLKIDRLRARLAEWVERLQWADGLTDVVEQMREEVDHD